MGCDQCGKFGYHGRVGIQEVFAVTPAIREAIQNGASESELQALANRSGTLNVFMDGIAKSVGGLTTLEEVYKAVVADA